MHVPALNWLLLTTYADWVYMHDRYDNMTFIYERFFPGLFFYVYIESLNPKKNKKATYHRHQIPSTEHPQPQKLTPRPQLENTNQHTTIE